jgi:hypothetical protein
VIAGVFVGEILGGKRQVTRAFPLVFKVLGGIVIRPSYYIGQFGPFD